MPYAVTITEITPSERKPEGEIISHTLIANSMSAALHIIEQANLNWTCFINVSITNLDEAKH